MKRLFHYTRLYGKNRSGSRVVDIGNAGCFDAVVFNPGVPPDQEIVDSTVFNSIHRIMSPTHSTSFSAFRSDDYPDILFIVWREFPYLPQIEEGGDLMLQVLADDKIVNKLLIDTTHVKSGWMDANSVQKYLLQAWFPGLIELELKAFCLIQAESFLGSKSFEQFGEFVSKDLKEVADTLDKKVFEYFPFETSSFNLNARDADSSRLTMLRKAIEIITA